MIENNYYDHMDSLDFPHLVSAAENIAWIHTSTSVLDEEEANWVAERLFVAWKASKGHNKILLRELTASDIYNKDFAIDGVSFYGEFDKSKGTYSVKATYHSSTSSSLWDTSDTTNEYSPGYKPKAKTSHIPEENILNITEIFK